MKKATLAIVGIVGIFLVLGILTAMVMAFGPGGGDGQAAGDGATPTAAEATPLPTETPNATNGTANGTATPEGGDANGTATPDGNATATPGSGAGTDTATPTPTPIRSTGDAVNESNVSAAIVSKVNDQRASRGLDALSDDSRSASQLAEMAEYHTRNMADIGVRTHEYDGNWSVDRYRKWGLYERCQFQSAGGGHIVTSKQNQLEALAEIDVSGYANQTMPHQELERRIAADVVNDWFDRHHPRKRLTYENARYVGVGVEFTSDDTVYVTANLC